jgi:hypothetical protein
LKDLLMTAQHAKSPHNEDLELWRSLKLYLSQSDYGSWYLNALWQLSFQMKGGPKLFNLGQHLVFCGIGIVPSFKGKVTCPKIGTC